MTSLGKNFLLNGWDLATGFRTNNVWKKSSFVYTIYSTGSSLSIDDNCVRFVSSGSSFVDCAEKLRRHVFNKSHPTYVGWGIPSDGTVSKIDDLINEYNLFFTHEV